MPAAAPLLPARERGAAPATAGFCWATGIEDTFIAQPWAGTGRSLDEYELTRHYERWEDDLLRVRELGVPAVRYGIPWHRVHLGPGRFDFGFADRTLGWLLDHGVAPIVDLVHYGTPLWLEGAFLHPDYPRHVAEYAAALAERFRGRLRWFTPMNEPRIAAWYAGQIGWWPPNARGAAGFLRVLLAACRGIRATVSALRQVDPELEIVHVDATDLYETDDPSLGDEVARRQQIVFLALDLLTGRIAPGHGLYAWLLRSGLSEAELAAFREEPLELGVLGINLYPMFSAKRVRRRSGRLRVRPIAAGAEIVSRLAELYHRRYRCPIFLSETAALGTPSRRLRWLRDSVAEVRSARARGIPIVGYTWWPLFALVAWAYRQSSARGIAEHLLQMGLFDLDPRDLERVHTPVVDAYRELVRGGTAAVGTLACGGTSPGA
jgi:beta-glucosidase/6-phospho-beta-glucosidase/beta-galactosidase